MTSRTPSDGLLVFIERKERGREKSLLCRLWKESSCRISVSDYSVQRNSYSPLLWIEKVRRSLSPSLAVTTTVMVREPPDQLYGTEDDLGCSTCFGGSTYINHFSLIVVRFEKTILIRQIVFTLTLKVSMISYSVNRLIVLLLFSFPYLVLSLL